MKFKNEIMASLGIIFYVSMLVGVCESFTEHSVFALMLSWRDKCAPTDRAVLTNGQPPPVWLNNVSGQQQPKQEQQQH